MLSVVIPTFNEKDNIHPLVSRINAALENIPHEIIFVDDSNDETPDIIRSVAAEDGHIRLFHRENEKGLATAVVKGFSLAEGDFVACMDADLQHPPEVLRDMYAAMLSHADMAIPSRLIPGGDDGGLDFIRNFISTSARMLAKFLLPCLRPVSDPTSGLFMVRSDLLKGAALNPIGWKIMVEVLAMCPIRNILETPYSFADRTAGESKISLKVSLQFIRQLINLRLHSPNGSSRPRVIRWTKPKLAERKEKLSL